MRDFDRRVLLSRLGLAAAAALLHSAPAHAQLRRVTIGANPAGTNFNVIAGGFAKVIQEQLGLPSIVRPYAGSSVYVPMLHRGDITLGINSSIDSYLAFRGEAPYPAPMTNLRGLMSVYPLGYMFWVRADSDIRSLADLRDRRVVLDYRSLVHLNRLNRAVLATAGLGEEDVDAATAAGLPEGARLVAEHRADAVPMGYRLPLIRQMHATLPDGLRFLPVGDDEERVATMMPGAWVETVTPGANTIGIERPMRSAMYDTFLNGGLHVPDDDAYDLVRVLYASWDELRRDYTLLRDVTQDRLVPSNTPHPYHAGAVRYFREAGVWTDEHERNQSRLLSG